MNVISDVITRSTYDIYVTINTSTKYTTHSHTQKRKVRLAEGIRFAHFDLFASGKLLEESELSPSSTVLLFHLLRLNTKKEQKIGHRTNKNQLSKEINTTALGQQETDR